MADEFVITQSFLDKVRSGIGLDQLLEDISVTERELSAYEGLVENFIVLQRLPESSKGVYVIEVLNYSLLSNECRKLLNKLTALRDHVEAHGWNIPDEDDPRQEREDVLPPIF